MHVCEQCLHDFGRHDNLQRHKNKGCKGLPEPPFKLCDLCFAFVKGNQFHLDRHKASRKKCVSLLERAAQVADIQTRRRAQDADRHRAARARGRARHADAEQVLEEQTEAAPGVGFTDDLFAMDLSVSTDILTDLFSDLIDDVTVAPSTDVSSAPPNSASTDSEPVPRDSDQTQSDRQTDIESVVPIESDGDYGKYGGIKPIYYEQSTNEADGSTIEADRVQLRQTRSTVEADVGTIEVD